MCLLCAAGLALGTYGEISGTDAQRDADAVRSIVLDTAVLHAGDVVQGYCSDTSGDRWSTGGAGGMAMIGPASRTDLTDTRSPGLLQELLNFSFEGETAARMAQFDSDIDRCEKASGETFPENVRTGVPLRMLPDGPLK